MDMAKCSINFPNVNRIPKGPKINNVLISGDVAHVEEVRKEMRVCLLSIQHRQLMINLFLVSDSNSFGHQQLQTQPGRYAQCH
jgi:hypothetical protein